jgi:hypothetical protein
MADSKKKKDALKIPANYKPLAKSERRARKGTHRTGSADPKEIVNVTICVRRRPGAPSLPTQDHWSKTLPGRRKYLSQEDFATQYGAAQSDLVKVADFARSSGLTVASTSTVQRTVLVSGTVEQMNKAFGVDLGMYESATEKYRGREGAVHLPGDIVGTVEGVFGLDNRQMARRSGGFTATSPITPIQVAQDYNFPAGNAAHQTIGVLEFSDPVEGTCGFLPSDVSDYFTTNLGIGPGFITPTLTPVTVNGPGNSPGGANDLEVMVDICVAASAAQQAAINVYFATWDENGWVLAVKEAVHPTQGETRPSVVSICFQWGEFESFDNLSWTAAAMDQVDTTLQEAAAAGITVLTAAGDQGSACQESDSKAHVYYPYSDPWVTCCGGTEIGTENGSYAEVTWPSTGGGISANFPLPAWQQGVGVPPSVNPPHSTGRGIPDIAGYANGYSFVLGGLNTGSVSGTSETAPLYAGLIALINESLGDPVGYLNPTLYAIATQPGWTPVFRDINDGTSNAQGGSPGYTSGPGWDACTGWGVMDGSALLANLQTLFQKTLTFVMQRTTFGNDEVAATGSSFSQAFFITVDGLTPSDFPGGGITTLTATQAQLNQWAPSIPDPVGPAGATNITITPSAVSSDDPSLSPEVQRFTFTYTVTFPDNSAFTVPPASDFPEILTLNASLAAATGMLTASQDIELITAADPFFSSELNGGLYWLSEDIRVFYAVEGSTLFGAPALGSTSADALSFIQWIISHLSGPTGTSGVAGNTDSFEGLPTSEGGTGQLSLLPVTTDSPHKNIYNFAIARVRLNGLSEKAKTVRAFFRLFQSQSVNIPYQTPLSAMGVSAPTGAYRQWSDNVPDGQKAPLLGISTDGSEYITAPCFASTRALNTTAANNMTTQTDPPNVQSMTPIAGSTVYAYFGCWLDNNQNAGVFPFAPGANPDGPFTGQTLNTVAQVIDRGGHQCIVVEIVDDEAPIIDNATPGTSDKIAQRNLAFTTVANPGLSDSRLAAHTFEIRPSPTTFNAKERPDELMIDWGNVPKGSLASIYLPAVQASDVLALANRMYTIHNLTAADAHTLHCPTGGITYIPIPLGSGPNHAGLFSVQLPLGIKHGQEFKIVVRQITSSFENRQDLNAVEARAEVIPQRRFVYGSFQISIPVSIKTEMLVPAERNLSVLRWIQQTIPASSRWYAVFQRYITQLSDGVTALGGNGNTVPPTQTGIWPGLPGQGSGSGSGKGPGHHAHDRSSFTGKVDGIVYDHFGDFEAFILETLEGERHRFESHEASVHKLAQRAWAHRILVTVVVLHDHRERPIEIILHGAPPLFEE